MRAGGSILGCAVPRRQLRMPSNLRVHVNKHADWVGDRGQHEQDDALAGGPVSDWWPPMKLKDHFDDFLNDTVNLNATRLQQLEDSVEALKDVVRASNWAPTITGWAGQGSWAHRTIIKPVKDRPFDADLLVYVKPVEGWDAKQYLTKLREVFAAHGTYSDKVQRFSHCVTITYAGERKIDIAPVVVDRDGVTRLEVCNFDTNTFERTEPKLYTAWLIERNGWTGGNGLRKVTRLLKYLRDIKTTFTCPSILLTTLLGERIMAGDADNTTDFADVPTALRTIVARLDNWLQARPSRPAVFNPKLTTEDLSGAWDDNRYANFRERIHTYRGWIDDAYQEVDRDESILKWQRVFGDEFANSVLIEKADRAADEATLINEVASTGVDLVAKFARLGRLALPRGFDRRLAHKKPPTWRALASPAFHVRVEATLHSSKHGVWLDSVDPDSGAALPKGRYLNFKARTQTGLPLAGDYAVHWRITNTDAQARNAGVLRGGFERSNDGSTRWEELEYRGVHTVEAFVIRQRDSLLVAQSDPFYVVVE